MGRAVNPVYRVCRKCGREWNVSRLDPGEKNYICPTCEFKERLKKGGGKWAK